LGVLAKPLGALLHLIYNMVGNYGVAIILFTIVVKVILLPLTFKQLQSTKAMNDIQPELKKLQEKYKNDKTTLNEKTMSLYKEHSINPMAGCLPLLIQLPILFGLFAALRAPIEYVFAGDAAAAAVATSAPFLWMANLLDPDVLTVPFSLPLLGNKIPWILPIIAAVTTYFSMVMSAGKQKGGTQPQSMKTMSIMMPFMILFWGVGFPAGLTLYWAVSNVFQMVQQYFLNHRSNVKEA
jgi:YidC/Oxa1 family membrane protein insertase